MMLQPVPVVGGCYADDTKPYSAQDCVNWLPERAEVQGGRSNERLLNPPGLTAFCTATDGVVRGLRNVEGGLYAVIGETLYSVAQDGTETALGTVPGSGRVSMTHNQITGGNEIVIVNGSQGFVYNTATALFEQITDDAFEGSIVTGYLNQYVLHIETARRYWFHSDLSAAKQYISLDRYEGESNPDRMVSLLVDHAEVWVFNERSIDVFGNSVSESAAFERSGAIIELGCAGTFSPAKMDNSVFWLGNDGIFYRANGYTPTRISTHAIEQAIAHLDWSSCYSTVWEDRGHKVVYWTFTDGQTWGFDVATGLWHRRKSYGFENWRVNHLVYWNGQWIAGDAYAPKLYSVDWQNFTEDGSPMERIRVTGNVHNNQNRVRVDMVEVVASVGRAEQDDTDYMMELAWSDDGGYTFGNWYGRSLGAVGQYLTRCAWRKLGHTRNRVFSIRVTSPVKCDLIAASAALA